MRTVYITPAVVLMYLGVRAIQFWVFVDNTCVRFLVDKKETYNWVQHFMPGFVTVTNDTEQSIFVSEIMIKIKNLISEVKGI